MGDGLTSGTMKLIAISFQEKERAEGLKILGKGA